MLTGNSNYLRQPLIEPKKQRFYDTNSTLILEIFMNYVCSIIISAFTCLHYFNCHVSKCTTKAEFLSTDALFISHLYSNSQFLSLRLIHQVVLELDFSVPF